MRSLLLPLALAGFLFSNQVTAAGEILALCGASLKPPLEELGAEFEKETGIRVVFTFGAAGALLSQVKFSKTGDVLIIPEGSDYVQRAEREGLVRSGTERRLAFLIPALLVKKGNPKGIKGLEDLARPGVRVALGNPEAVAAGALAREILKSNGLWEKVRGNVVTYTETGPKLVTLLALGAVDAVIGFRVWGLQNREMVEVIELRPEQIPRVSIVSGAISAYCRNPKDAEAFLLFLEGQRGREVFRRWGYVVTEEEAKVFAPRAVGR